MQGEGGRVGGVEVILEKSLLGSTQLLHRTAC